MELDVIPRQYYRQISQLLPCSRRDKRRCLAELKANIAAYRQQRPNATAVEIFHRFGTPQEVADAWLESPHTQRVYRYQRHTRRCAMAALTVGLVLAVFLGIVAMLDRRSTKDFQDGKVVRIVEKGETAEDIINELDSKTVEVH